MPVGELHGNGMCNEGQPGFSAGRNSERRKAALYMMDGGLCLCLCHMVLNIKRELKKGDMSWGAIFMFYQRQFVLSFWQYWHFKFQAGLG